MRISRIHLDLNQNQVADTLSITGQQAHYLRNVLRLKAGHTLIFFTNDGAEYTATIAHCERHEITINNIQASANPIPPSRINATIIQGISASDRMDYTVQKSAELGARCLQPVFTEFSSQKIPKNKWDKKQAHWQGVANSAAEQCGRCDLMDIHPIMNLKDFFRDWQGNGVFLEPTAEHKLADLPQEWTKDMTVFIGPEGGFSENELNLFKQHKLMGIQLGQRILRTETAAPAILAGAHALFGDFN